MIFYIPKNSSIKRDRCLKSGLHRSLVTSTNNCKSITYISTTQFVLINELLTWSLLNCWCVCETIFFKESLGSPAVPSTINSKVVATTQHSITIKCFVRIALNLLKYLRNLRLECRPGNVDVVENATAVACVVVDLLNSFGPSRMNRFCVRLCVFEKKGKCCIYFTVHSFNL